MADRDGRATARIRGPKHCDWRGTGRGRRFHADKELEITADLKEVFQHAFAQGEFEVAAIVGISEDEAGGGFYVRVEWVGFGPAENS